MLEDVLRRVEHLLAAKALHLRVRSLAGPHLTERDWDGSLAKHPGNDPGKKKAKDTQSNDCQDRQGRNNIV